MIDFEPKRVKIALEANIEFHQVFTTQYTHNVTKFLHCHAHKSIIP